MADIVDLANELMEVREAAHLAEIRRMVEAMAKGIPGECDACGEERQRLINGVCATCRDKFKLP